MLAFHCSLLPRPRCSRRERAAACALLALLLGCCVPSACLAGGGPENMLLVVNPSSTASMTIANHYIDWRRIPAVNVLYLPWDPAVEQTDVDVFRPKILAPVIEAVSPRELAPKIDHLVYSSDYPWGINCRPDVNRYLAAVKKHRAEAANTHDKPAGQEDTAPKTEAPRDEANATKPKPTGSAEEAAAASGAPEPRWAKHLTPVGSLNGLTYLWRQVMTGDPQRYMDLKNNQYMRRSIPQQQDVPTLAFSATTQFGPHGELVKTGGRQYLLSMMLAVTAGRGNTVDEVLAYLRRSIEADATHPPGTIYFVKNRNIRSLVRQRAYPAVVRELAGLNVTAEILVGTMPEDKADVQGVMMGTAKFDWKRSGSSIRPGAICDHLTSFGGVMRSDASQTSLAEFLRFGAAGSSGTVTEPYAIQEKFPFAMIQVHYARGCSLAEAFYQSVYGPYQLLIVGDPLCRPWARVPKVVLTNLEAGQEVSGTVKLRPRVDEVAPEDEGSAENEAGPDLKPIERFRIFIDGKLRAECAPGGTVTLDTTQLADGYHEIRAAAIRSGLIKSQGHVIVGVKTANHGHRIEASCRPAATAGYEEKVAVSAKAAGAKRIAVLQNARLLGSISGEEGELKLEASKLGAGPVELRVIALTEAEGKPAPLAIAEPLKLTVGRPGTDTQATP